MRPRSLALLAGLILVAAGRGQEKDAKPAPKADGNAIEVRFADDSTVKMVLLHGSIDVSTRYGKLTVPGEEIRRIEFGRRVTEETAKKIDAAIARLGSADFKQREAAGGELVELREMAYSALQAAAKSGNPEVSRRAREALKTITESVPPEKLQQPRHDTVVAQGFTIVGQIETPALKVRSPYFGEATLQLTDLRSLRSLGTDREVKLAVDAAKYASPQQETWFDTGIELHTGAGVQISAGGTVDLRPQPGEAGTFVSGPDGYNSRGPRGAAGVAMQGGPGGGGFAAGGRGGRPGFGPGMSQGALLGRIGENGRVFVVGSRFEGTALDDGKLYLRIVPSSNSNEASGSYDVRVIAGK